MSYNIEGAMSYCNFKTKKDFTTIRNEIIKAWGKNPNNKTDVINFYDKKNGKIRRLDQEEFQAICKVCGCPASLLAETEE